MPTISFEFSDLQKLVGQAITIDKFEEYLEKAKGELESNENGVISVSLDDTNQPYLWGVEGLARFIRQTSSFSDKKLKIENSEYEVIVDQSVKHIRPYLSGFVAKGHEFDDYLIKQFVQLQEKICEGFGRKREHVSIGIYKSAKIKWPVHYRAVRPNEVNFIPLDFDESMTLSSILDKHPKGKEYGWILFKHDNYPILVDSAHEILSFPPIINSRSLGKIEPNDNEVFVEVTGLSEKAVNLAAVIFAYAMSDRGFSILSCKVKHPGTSVNSPVLVSEKMKLDKKEVERILGLNLKENELRNILSKSGFLYHNGEVEIPPFRHDIIHQVDLIEEIAIQFGFDKFLGLDQKNYTPSSLLPKTEYSDKVRLFFAGSLFQEVFSQILTNPKLMQGFDSPVEIEEFRSENYSCVRSAILPQIMEFLSQNTHETYPQKVFEAGSICYVDTDVVEEEHLAFASSSSESNFTQAKQEVEAMLLLFNIKFEIKEYESLYFIPGRAAKIMANNEMIAYFGEISPEVLSRFSIGLPVYGGEINITKLMKNETGN